MPALSIARILAGAAILAICLPCSAATATSATTGTTPARVTPTPFTAAQVATHFLPKNAPTSYDNIVSLVYNSARRSQLDPCGCVGKQLGGVDKEARLPAWLKEQGVPAIQLDAGGYLKNASSPIWVMQTRLLLRGMAEMKIDVINVGADDLAAGLKMIQEEQSSASLPLISANIVDNGKPIFPPYKVIEAKTKAGQDVRVGVIGVTRPAVKAAPRRTPAAATTGTATRTTTTQAWMLELPKGLGADPTPAAGNEAYEIIDQSEAVKQYLPELREKSDIVVLLDYEARDFVKRTLTRIGEDADKIDVAIAGEYMAPIGTIEMVGKTRLVSSGFEGRYVGHMMLQLQDTTITSATNILVEVLQSIPSVPELTVLMNNAREEVKKFTAEQRQKSGGGVTQSSSKITFAGQAACQQCHPKEHQQWKTTSHAKAMATLVEANAQNDPNCVKCHVTGFREDNGFQDLASTPKMADVQCEVCHGPAFQHVVTKRREQIMKRMAQASPTPNVPQTETPKLRTKFDEQFCMQCHDANNDPKFDFARDIKLVDHSTTAKRPDDAPVTRQTTGPAARAANIPEPVQH